MSHKGRLRRLEAGVHWLETEGLCRHIEAGLRTLEMLQTIADRQATDPAFAARWKRDFPNFPIKLPPPSAGVRPAPPVAATPQREEVREERPPEEHRDEEGRVPTLRDAAPGAAAEGRVRALPAEEGRVQTRAPPACPPPPPAKSRWTKDVRPGPHDVLTSEEAIQVPWLESEN